MLFNRPDAEQRKKVLESFLTGLDVTAQGQSATQLNELVTLTGLRGSEPGYTYPDLTQRLAPAAVLAAFPRTALTVDGFLHAVATTSATHGSAATAPRVTTGPASRTGRTTAVTNTNPLGWCFVSYRRARKSEITDLVRALHEQGIPTWQDLHDLDEQPLEAALRAVLEDSNTACGVLWVTPEVADSPTITNVEVSGLTDPVFALVPVAAGGLDYDGADGAARSATTLVDLRTWNIGKVDGDPASAHDITAVAQRVLRRRVPTIHGHLAPGEPFAHHGARPVPRHRPRHRARRASAPVRLPGARRRPRQAVVRTIRSARSRYGTIGAVHLFIAGPAGLAFLMAPAPQ